MDHVIDGIKTFLEISMDYLREEWRSGEYKKLSDCPSYLECKAMVDAIHILEKYYYGEHKTMSVRDNIMFD
ncbi:hypothetical protein V6C27_02745 [Peptococcaceae bacterium 1198_IL3148]